MSTSPSQEFNEFIQGRLKDAFSDHGAKIIHEKLLFALNPDNQAYERDILRAVCKKYDAEMMQTKYVKTLPIAQCLVEPENADAFQQEVFKMLDILRTDIDLKNDVSIETEDFKLKPPTQ